MFSLLLKDLISDFILYWFWGQIICLLPGLSLFFLAYQRTGYPLRVREKKRPRPKRPMGRPLSHYLHCKLYCVSRHWESCMWTSQQTWRRNQPKHIFMSQDWSLEIVTSFTTRRKALRTIVRHVRKPPRDWFWLWDCLRPLRLAIRCFCGRLRLSRSTINKMVTMSFKAYVQLPGIFDCFLFVCVEA